MSYVQQFIQLPWWKWVAVALVALVAIGALALKFFRVSVNIRNPLSLERKALTGPVSNSTGSVIGDESPLSFTSKVRNKICSLFSSFRKKATNGANWLWNKTKAGASWLWEKSKRQWRIFSVLYKKRAVEKSIAEGKDPKAESEVNRFQVGVLLAAVLFGFFKFRNWNSSPSGFFTRFWTSFSGWFGNIDFTWILIIVAIVASVTLAIYLIYRGSKSLSVEDGKIKLPKGATGMGMQHIPVSNIFNFLGVLVFVLIALATARWVLSTFYNDWYTAHVLTDRAWVLQVALFITLMLWMAASSFPSGRKYVVKPLLLLILFCVAMTAFTGFDYNRTRDEVKGYFTDKPVIKTSAWNWENETCVEDDAVRKAFPSDTTMWKIARVESDCMQFKSNGALVKNPKSSAVGIFQILEDTHGRDCGIDGVDIHTLEGNISCARNLSLRNPNYSDWDESAGRWRDGYRIDTVVIPTAPPVIVTMIERIAIDTILIKLEGDSSWSEVIDTKTLPTTYSRGGNSTYSQQDCIDEEICEGQIYSGLSNTKRDLGNARFVRLRSDSAAMWMRIEIGRRLN